MSAADAFTELVQIMQRLRAPGGCPWDREQNHASIKPYLIEEAYEVAEAIDDNDFDELRKELGDLLLQVVFHAQMAQEAGRFGIEDVVRGINEKMTRRHPHVFADTEVSGSEEVLRNWARIKSEERKDRPDNSVVAGVPRALPALLRAHRLGEKASHIGFDWSQPAEVLAKVDEELAELRAAIDAGDDKATKDELGDVLLALSSLGRHLQVHSEEALQEASDRFIARFRYVEARLADLRRDPHDSSPDELNRLWEEAKKHFASSSS
jgi:tetrapyrrole methylase family protein/MazG family protein